MTEVNNLGIAERYRLLTELSPDAIAIHQDGIVVYVNGAALRFAGLATADEMLGRPILDFVHPDSVQSMVERLIAMGTREGASTAPEDVLMMDDKKVPRLMEVTSVRTVWSGRPAYQVILRDISAQKRIESAERLRVAVVDHVTNAVVNVDPDLRIRSWNPGAERMFGISQCEVLGRLWTEVTASDIELDAMVGSVEQVTSVYRRASGRRFLARSAVTATDAGYLIVISTAGRPLMERLDSILAALHQAVIVVDADGAVELANPAAHSMFGRADETLLGVSAESLPLQFPGARSPITDCLQDGTAAADRVAALPDAAGDRWVLCSCRCLDPEEPDSSVLVSIVDISEQHRRVVQLDWEANHDTLTALFNRAGVIREIGRRLGEMESDHTIVVCCLDVSDFSALTDLLGFQEADDVLKVIAQRIDDASGHASVGRIGDASFVVVTTTTVPASYVPELVANVHTAVSRPIVHGARSDQVVLDVGVTIGNATPRTPANLVVDAAIAARVARQAARSPFVEFRPEHREELERRREVERELRETLRTDPARLRVVYQPIVQIDNRRVTAVEALLRWDHPELGTIPPDSFIPIAEESDLIDLIGTHVLTLAVEEFVATPWTSEMILSINMSRRQLTDRELPGRIAECLRLRGLPASRLCVEVTESSLTDVSAGVAEIRELGVLIALDDFGTGASTLSQLQRLPVDLVKTDKQFVDAVVEERSARVTLAAIASITEACDMQVIVEGVETAEQAAIVAESGATFAQGYHYSRPTSLEALGEMLADGGSL
ncbi:EAL domain-containing protein [Gordonia sp. TBRC 11910]|uniref:EAL domain-containing protein n=1 Tax=Gordonia asplenii TaxID=2725283 RepID=A0A848KVG2_9ACTN|nr:EAL domain-containing protein [Gordonia asplenii]NMO02656.1 EAL domain-containing protein [Gordonia asplenii]